MRTRFRLNFVFSGKRKTQIRVPNYIVWKITPPINMGASKIAKM